MFRFCIIVLAATTSTAVLGQDPYEPPLELSSVPGGMAGGIGGLELSSVPGGMAGGIGGLELSSVPGGMAGGIGGLELSSVPGGMAGGIGGPELSSVPGGMAGGIGGLELSSVPGGMAGGIGGPELSSVPGDMAGGIGGLELSSVPGGMAGGIGGLELSSVPGGMAGGIGGPELSSVPGGMAGGIGGLELSSVPGGMAGGIGGPELSSVPGGMAGGIGGPELSSVPGGMAGGIGGPELSSVPGGMAGGIGGPELSSVPGGMAGGIGGPELSSVPGGMVAGIGGPEPGGLASEDTVAELVRQAGISVAADSFGVAVQIVVTEVTGNVVAGSVAGEAVKATVEEVLDVGGQQIGDAIGKSLHTWRLEIAAQSELAERARWEQEWKEFLNSNEPDSGSASMAPMSGKEVEVVDEVSEPEHTAMAPPMPRVNQSHEENLLGGSQQYVIPHEDELEAFRDANDELRRDEFDAPDGDVGVRHGDYFDQGDGSLRKDLKELLAGVDRLNDLINRENRPRMCSVDDDPCTVMLVRSGCSCHCGTVTCDQIDPLTLGDPDPPLPPYIADSLGDSSYDFGGKQGDAVDLVIGYQPYYTESWSGVVNNGKGFWKNYLPEGSTAKFEIGLQGSVIVNAMTGEKQHVGYMGDMPAIASTFRNIKERGGTDIHIVAVLGTAGKLDAGAIREPIASKIVKASIARRAASGEDFDALDGGFMVMLNDLVSQRPDVHRGWLEAELDAQLFMLDPANADDVASMAEAQTEQIDQDVLKHSLFGAWPAEQGGGDVKVQLDFIVTERVQGLLDNATAFLYSLPKKPVAAATIRDGGVVDEVARAILKDRGQRQSSSPLLGSMVSARSMSEGI